MRIVRRARPRALISLTPLIDVVFILLVFFMLASSFADWRAIELMTAGQAVRAPSPDPAVLVRVQADGSLDLGGERLTAEALPARLAALAAADAERRLAVQPEAGVPLQRVVDVLDAATAAGLRRVSLVGGGAGG